jgi:hypothetical protein
MSGKPVLQGLIRLLSQVDLVLFGAGVICSFNVVGRFDYGMLCVGCLVLWNVSNVRHFVHCVMGRDLWDVT